MYYKLLLLLLHLKTYIIPSYNYLKHYNFPVVVLYKFYNVHRNLFETVYLGTHSKYKKFFLTEYIRLVYIVSKN